MPEKRSKRLVVPLSPEEEQELVLCLPAGVKKAEFVRRLIRGYLKTGRIDADDNGDKGVDRAEALELLAKKARDGNVQATVALARELRADESAGGDQRDGLEQILGNT